MASSAPGERFVRIDGHPVPFVRLEIGVPVLADVSPQTLSHVQEPELRPQVHEPVTAGCPRKAHDPFHLGPQGLHGFEPLGLLVLERRQFVQDHHIKIQPAVLAKPHQVLPVHDVKVCWLLESPPPFRHGPYHHAAGELLQVVPFPEFFRPSISRYSEGGHDQNPVDFKGVIHQIPNSRQGRHRLAEPKPISSRRAVTGWVLMYSMA